MKNNKTQWKLLLFLQYLIIVNLCVAQATNISTEHEILNFEKATSYYALSDGEFNKKFPSSQADEVWWFKGEPPRGSRAERKPSAIGPIQFTNRNPEEVSEKVDKNRKKVKEITSLPYRTIGLLEMKFAIDQEKPDLATGVLVGPCHVLTAAHNLYDRKAKCWAKEIIFYPALQNNIPVSEKVHGVCLLVPYLWVKGEPGEDKQNDIGMVVVSPNGDSSIGYEVGWTGITTGSFSKTQNVELAGYPGDLYKNQTVPVMYKMGCLLSDLKSSEDSQSPNEVFHYPLYSDAGNSGSPVLIDGEKTSYIFGIHAYGARNEDGYRQATKISPSKFKLILNWIQHYWPGNSLEEAIDQLQQGVRHIRSKVDSETGGGGRFFEELVNREALTRLDLSQSSLIFTEKLAEKLSLPSLEELILSNCGLIDNDVTVLLYGGLKRKTEDRLRILNLADNKLTTVVVRNLEEYAKTNSNLLKIDLRGNTSLVLTNVDQPPRNPPDDQELIQVLDANRKLEFDKFQKNLLENSFQSLLKHLRKKQYRLRDDEEVKKSGDQVSTWDEAMALLLWASRTERLQRIRASNMGLSDDIIPVLCLILQISNSDNLKELDVGQNDISGTSLDDLLSVVKPTLATLKLAGNPIGLKELVSLARFAILGKIQIVLEDKSREDFLSNIKSILRPVQHRFLDLSGFNKVYSISLDDLEALKHLNTLVRLEMRANKLTYAKVTILARNLPRLTYLDLSDNWVDDPGAEKISEILSDLEVLILANNHLTTFGVIQIYERLTRLTKLDLQGQSNVIDNSIVLTMAQRSYIDLRIDNEQQILVGRIRDVRDGRSTRLNLQNLGLRGLESMLDLSQLTRLTDLDLGRNQLNDQDARSIREHLTALTYLDVSDNQLTTVGYLTLAQIPEILLTVSRIEKDEEAVNRVQNALKGDLELTLDNLDLKEIDFFEFEKFTHLTELNLAGNSLIGNAIDLLTTHLTQLVYLDLSNNNLTDESVTQIAQRLPNLTHLNLSRNEMLTDVSAESVVDMPNLQELSIEGTQIGRVGALQLAQANRGRLTLRVKAGRLERLAQANRGPLTLRVRVKAGRLERLVTQVQGAIRGDQSLRLREVGLPAVRVIRFRRFKHLTRLNLANNSLEEHVVDSLTKHLTQLAHLDLSNNNLTDESVTQIAQRLPNLTHLYLSGNEKLTDVSAASVVDIPNLQVLSIEDTQIGIEGTLKLAQRDTLTELTVVDDYQNYANQVRRILGGDETVLGLSSLDLENLGILQLKKFANLTDLDLSENRLQEGAIKLFPKHLKDLVILNLRNNNIQEFEVNLRKLEDLDISGNKITDESLIYISSHMGKLRRLILANTNISERGINNIHSLSHLQELDLSHISGGEHPKRVSSGGFFSKTIRESVQTIAKLTELQTLRLKDYPPLKKSDVTHLLGNLKLTRLDLVGSIPQEKERKVKAELEKHSKVHSDL